MSDKIKRNRANIFDISPFGKGLLFNLNRKEKLKDTYKVLSVSWRAFQLQVGSFNVTLVRQRLIYCFAQGWSTYICSSSVSYSMYGSSLVCAGGR